ncbi:DNA-binding SARP family transcriptional activator [Amycolatopsis echigonensis]|uniref:DNA-binding SARP family transcriptional activator n=1 Tax=Amycolatopsis echigonensis TaxID=2576905 RepID=A0A2N3WJC9_9PSEU|nr:AfsR/SARP family transcriptional regulator [Amycolatopsis niigatensis]PKV93968.1 DNA-binding SARP family transcriptional activator [Amycolatopsis niigatensis]
MLFNILGPFEVRNAGGELRLTAPKLRQVLALLVARNNQPVQISELIDELWGDTPPISAQPTLQTYIYKLRKILLAQIGLPEVSLDTSYSGYLLSLEEDAVDFRRFERLLNEGRALLPGEPERAARVLADALALWRGPALADVPVGGILAPYVARLEELRLAALDLRVDADLRLGKHKVLVSELRGLTKEYPLQENIYAQLMLALYRSGRSSEALQTYQQLRTILVEQLGTEPTSRVQELHQAMLSCDPSLDLSLAPSDASEHTKTGWPAPAQLPPSTPDLVHRQRQFSRLRECTMTDLDTRSLAAVAAVTGPPGTGKTALTVNFALAVRDEFPDGQLIATLNEGGCPADPNDVLDQFLRAANVPGPIPGGLDERAKLFRSWGAPRQVLVVLDDADSFAQIRPLVLSGPRTITLVTSRNRLAGLPASRTIELGPLNTEQGVLMLEGILGRIEAPDERRAACHLVELCGGVPLALRSAAHRLMATHGRSLAWFTQRLRDPGRRLELLCCEDIDPRQLYDRAYRSLNTAELTVLRVLTLLPDKEFDSSEVTKLLRHDWRVVDKILGRLADLHLLTVLRHSGEVRYSFNELALAYARERLQQDLSLDLRQEQRTPFPAGLVDLQMRA